MTPPTNYRYAGGYNRCVGGGSDATTASGGVKGAERVAGVGKTQAAGAVAAGHPNRTMTPPYNSLYERSDKLESIFP